jgi:hypothetical protein
MACEGVAEPSGWHGPVARSGHPYVFPTSYAAARGVVGAVLRAWGGCAS